MRVRRRAGGAVRLAAACGTAVLAVSALSACAAPRHDDVVNLYYAPEENLQTVVDRCNDQADGRYRIVYHKLPRDADGQREQLVRRLAAQDDGMDVLGLDTTWTAEFARAGWVREWTGADRRRAEDGTLAGPLASARYGGKLFGAPKNTNVQLLWYRSDVVDRPPRTWDEMIEQAKRFEAAGEPSTILVPGAQFEGYVVQFNTLLASAGGKLISDDGTRAVVDEGVVRALEQLKALADSGLTSRSMSNSQEDDVRLEFQQGDAAFQLNWPFVYPSMQEDAPDIARNVRWARYPSSDPARPSKVTLGGFNLAVSAHSPNPQASFDAALCLRSPDSQRFSAIHDGVPPTIESVYAAPEMAAEYPMRDTILEELRDPAIRPITPAYQNVSTVLSKLLSPASRIDPPRTAERIRTEVQNALDSRGVLP
ncbi:ABC transporter substrate-binding protein [Saccharopolyspora sp. 6M]|uniref:ABC transporter substrate-binding protein n=1 Tax=Saccharopolyspora sp. 6M TaxID=2877237 RepID=UPI001CD40F51|nr:ABC transporter substrate-binding protein [Saccharopolyspora sp. 6M]MCA1225181.1 ABC transporter substrate-binding protein [Saccharopolyspora sp. 6M]